MYGVKSVQRLFAIVGIANAKRMLYSGERYDAERARGMGLVDEVCDNAVAAAMAFAGTLASNAPLSIAGAKFMLNRLSMGGRRARHGGGATDDRSGGRQRRFQGRKASFRRKTGAEVSRPVIARFVGRARVRLQRAVKTSQMKPAAFDYVAHER